jgi:hypothetical protein
MTVAVVAALGTVGVAEAVVRQGGAASHRDGYVARLADTASGPARRPTPWRSRTPRPATPTGTPTPSPSRSGAPSTAPSTPAGSTPGSAGSAITPPPANAEFDYQLGQPYGPPAGVRVVTRDRTASPAADLYNICYVNAFQTQPDEISWWRGSHPDLLLKRNGSDVVDSDWGEILLDLSSPAKRAALSSIVGGWIDGCAAKGYRAVEPDNLDSWTRSSGLLTKADALAFSADLAARAHRDGLAIGQKNAVELGTAGRAAGFDFAVAEECQEYTECQDYVGVYGAHVIVVEYDQSAFRKACTQFGGTLSVVLRDVDLTAPGSSSYQFATC